MARPVTITFDAADVSVLADFWATALDYERPAPPPEFDTWDAYADEQGIPADERDLIASVVDPDGVGPRLLFLKVPEGKAAKNRVHIDVHVGNGLPHDEKVAAQDAVVPTLVEAGATRVERVEAMGSTWVVMLDPEGNEFCVT